MKKSCQQNIHLKTKYKRYQKILTTLECPKLNPTFTSCLTASGENGPNLCSPRITTPDEYTNHVQWYLFFTQPAVRTRLLWKIPLKRALQGLQLPILHKRCSYGFPESPLTQKEYNKEGQREQSPIPFLLQISLSHSYLLHNSDVKRTIWKGHKV